MWNDGIYFIAEIQWKTASSQNFTEIGQSAAELWPQPIFNMAAVRHLEFEKKIIFGHLPVIEFQICICVPNFINIGWFFVQIWRFYDLQYGGHPPSWIFEILRFFSPDLYRHAILLPCAKFHWSRTIGCWVMAKKQFLKLGCPPSWILCLVFYRASAYDARYWYSNSVCPSVCP